MAPIPRLVGHAPTLEIVDAGLTPDVRVSPFTGTARPKVLLSRIILRAEGGEHGSAASFSFCIDQALANVLRPGDKLFMTRTLTTGLGLSIIRSGQLVAAAGAVANMLNGEGLDVGIPHDLIRQAELVFATVDPAFAFRELPIEVRVGTQRRVLNRGRAHIGAYEVFVEHGFYPGLPGTDECVAISLSGSCPDTAAISSAQLLEYSDLSG